MIFGRPWLSIIDRNRRDKSHLDFNWFGFVIDGVAMSISISSILNSAVSIFIISISQLSSLPFTWTAREWATTRSCTRSVNTSMSSSACQRDTSNQEMIATLVLQMASTASMTCAILARSRTRATSSHTSSAAWSPLALVSLLSSNRRSGIFPAY